MIRSFQGCSHRFYTCGNKSQRISSFESSIYFSIPKGMGGLVGISLILHEFVVYFRVLFPEATEDDITFIFPVPYVAFDGIPGYFCGSSVRITVHAGADAREGDTFQVGGLGHLQGGGIAGCQQLGLMCPPPCHTGPTVWMIFLQGSLYAPVILLSPVRHPPSVRHSSNNSLPAARCMAPSTPPPPNREQFAAFTMASTCSCVMSPTIIFIRSFMSRYAWFVAMLQK